MRTQGEVQFQIIGCLQTAEGTMKRAPKVSCDPGASTSSQTTADRCHTPAQTSSLLPHIYPATQQYSYPAIQLPNYLATQQQSFSHTDTATQITNRVDTQPRRHTHSNLAIDISSCIAIQPHTDSFNQTDTAIQLPNHIATQTPSRTATLTTTQPHGSRVTQSSTHSSVVQHLNSVVDKILLTFMNSFNRMLFSFDHEPRGLAAIWFTFKLHRDI